MKKQKNKVARTAVAKKTKVALPDHTRAKRKFTVVTSAGDEVQVEYDKAYNHHMAYSGPISETGHLSDFSFDGQGDPRVYARKMANEFQMELKLAKALVAKKDIAAKPTVEKVVAVAGDVKNPSQKMSALDAAQKVLADEGKAMSAAQIMAIILAKGYWTTAGKTPSNTLHAAIIRNIMTNPGHCRFRRASQKGQFLLNEPLVDKS